MKNLKDYVIESIWDVDDNIESSNDEVVISEAKRFIKDNYETVDLNRLTFVFDEDKGKFVTGYAGDLKLNDGAESIVNDLFEWGTVKGWFDCYSCPELKSLKGVPGYVRGYFNCSVCPKLESLQGAPEIVNGHFNCSGCPKLESLEGAPKSVGWGFYCINCTQLKTLEGAPEIIGGVFKCTGCPVLHSLDGIGEVGGRIISDIR